MRVLLADDQTSVRAALKQLLEWAPEFNIVGEASNTQDLLHQVQMTQPDVVLLNWELDAPSTLDRLSTLRALCRSLKVVAFGEEEAARQKALAIGAAAFVSKQDPPEWLMNTLRGVAGLSPCFV
jgi:DNA-binding NarL/FixJ family response regulator